MIPAITQVGSQWHSLFAHGMAWGINNRLLSRTTYEPVVARPECHAENRGASRRQTRIIRASASIRYLWAVTYESTSDFGVGSSPRGKRSHEVGR
jgi:hypothetical protein